MYVKSKGLGPPTSHPKPEPQEQEPCIPCTPELQPTEQLGESIATANLRAWPRGADFGSFTGIRAAIAALACCLRFFSVLGTSVGDPQAEIVSSSRSRTLDRLVSCTGNGYRYG